MATNVHNQDVYYLKTNTTDTLFMVKNICDKEAFVNLTKISCTQIKFDLQNLLLLKIPNSAIQLLIKSRENKIANALFLS